MVVRPFDRIPRHPVLQWLGIVALMMGAVRTFTSVSELKHLPADQWALVMALPNTWAPLGMIVVVLVGAALLEFWGQRLTKIGWIVVALVTIGGMAWFLRGGRIDWMNSRDWQKEWTYYAAIKEAIATRRLPWRLSSTFHYTNQFFANPETVVAPHLLALAWLRIPTFVFWQSLAVFTAGVLAVRQLARDLDFGPMATAAFLAIFTLNGYILGHLGGGHLEWISCFLFPAVMLFVYRLAAGSVSPRTEAGLAGALAAMLVIGGWHMFVWGIIFTGAFIVIDRSRWRAGIRVALLTAGFGAYRLLPAFFAHDGVSIEFLGSYRNISTLVAALVGDPRPFDGMMWIEYDSYVGWIGLLLVCAGVTVPLGKAWRQPIASLWVPSMVMLVLACGEVYRWTLFRLPGFVSQRVTTRFIIVSLLGFTAIGCAQLNTWLRQRRFVSLRLLVVVAAGVLMAAQLIVRAEQRRPPAYARVSVPVVSVLLPDAPGAGEIAALAVGTLISLASLAFGIRMWRTSEGASN